MTTREESLAAVGTNEILDKLSMQIARIEQAKNENWLVNWIRLEGLANELNAMIAARKSEAA